MSLYFSKFMLNTYSETPYFAAQLPPDYPLSLVLQKYRAFRRLPPNLQELSRLSKKWAARRLPGRCKDVEGWYDSDGYELDPDTGHRLTDAEIDAQWGGPDPDPSLDALGLTDISLPVGGFPNPDTWEEPAPAPPAPSGSAPVFRWGRWWGDSDDCLPTREQLLGDIAGHGRERTADEYGIQEDQLPTMTPEEEQAAWDAERTRFRLRAARVLDSPYFHGRPEDREFMAEALDGADAYDDLGGRAWGLFDAAEAATRAYY